MIPKSRAKRKVRLENYHLRVLGSGGNGCQIFRGFVALLILVNGLFTSTLAQTPSDPSNIRLRNKSYPIDEIYLAPTLQGEGSTPQANTAALEQFILLNLMSNSENRHIEGIATHRRQLSIALAHMKQAIERMQRKPSLSRSERAHLDVMQFDFVLAAHHFNQLPPISADAQKLVQDALIPSSEVSETLAELETIHHKTQRITEEIWTLQNRAILLGNQKLETLSEEDFQKQLDRNEFWVTTSSGRAEVNSIDGEIFIRVIHRSFDHAFTFKAWGDISVYSFHDAKYIASQHIMSGMDRMNRRRVRDEQIQDLVRIRVSQMEKRNGTRMSSLDVEMKSGEIATDIVSYRSEAIERMEERHAQTSPREFSRLIEDGSLNIQFENGSAEFFYVGDQLNISLKHNDLEDPLIFEARDRIPMEALKERGRDVVNCFKIRDPVTGEEKIDHVRVHLRPSRWSLQFREDNLLYLYSPVFTKKNWGNVRQGIIAGLLQTIILGAMDAASYALGHDDLAARPELYAFTLGFSTFWGVFQSWLRKFTNDPFLPVHEKTLRRAVTTGITYNSFAYIATYGIYAFDVTTPTGITNWVRLGLNITVSNLIKNWMEKEVETEQRAFLNTSEAVLRIPSRAIPGHPLTDDIVEIKLGTKEADFQLRAISLKTFSFRLADITDYKVVVPGLDFEIPIGKLIFWSAYPYYQWKAVKYAESIDSDLAPMLRAQWLRWHMPFLGRWPSLEIAVDGFTNRFLPSKPFMSTYVFPIIPLGRLGAYTFKQIGRAAQAVSLRSGELANRALYTDEARSNRRISRWRAASRWVKTTCALGLMMVRQINDSGSPMTEMNDPEAWNPDHHQFMGKEEKP